MLWQSLELLELQVDAVLWQSLELLDNAELPPHNLDEASFDELLLHMSLNRVSKSGWENRFVLQRFCGRVVEIVPGIHGAVRHVCMCVHAHYVKAACRAAGGKSLAISWANRKEFVAKALQFLQHEVLIRACGACFSCECVRYPPFFGLAGSTNRAVLRRPTFKCKPCVRGWAASSLCQC